MKELLNRFAEIDADKDGLVNVQEFANYLNLPLTRAVKRVFSLYDRVSSEHPGIPQSVFFKGGENETTLVDPSGHHSKNFGAQPCYKTYWWST